MDKNIILLSPAGSFESLSAAIHNGADAVYFGVGHLNMRSHGAVNFKIEDLREVVKLCHEAGVLAWLTLNTLIYEEELDQAEVLCQAAAEAGVDAVIASDIAAIQAAARHGLPVHLSVQANVCNTEAVRFFSRYCEAVVLARELTIEQIQAIHQAVQTEKICGPSGELVRLEVFTHGALCIGISGRCGMSLCGYNSSSCRGSCFQNCRRSYLVRDAETGFEMKIDHQYIMSPKDICMLRQLPQLLKAGCSIFKIEGRGRSADYVARVTSVYRRALDRILSKNMPSAQEYDVWMQELETVFNRGFWEGGYYLGRKLDPWGKSPDNHASKVKKYVGMVVDYYAKPQVAEVKVVDESLAVNDECLVTGHATGAVFFKITQLRNEAGCAVDTGRRGDDVTFPCTEKLRPGDKLYVLKAVADLEKKDNA